MMETTTVPGAEHYREIAGILREAAGSCQFARGAEGNIGMIGAFRGVELGYAA
jgi:hypothetical protein